MNQREVLTLGSAAGAAWPVGAWGQQHVARPIIGYIHATTADANREEVAAFEEGLKQRGYVNGQNVVIEYRWAEGRYDRLPLLAAEMVERHVALIVAGTPVAALAVKRATSTIPLVFAVGSD